MSTKELLQRYRRDVVSIKENAKKAGLSEEEVNVIQKECFGELKDKINRSKRTKHKTKAQILCQTFGYFFLLVSILFVSSYILLRVHQPTSSIVLRNVQGLTYPTLRVLRLLFVPILKLLPYLTDVYDESCLAENPYFYISDMECWPCESTNAVLNVTKVEENLFKLGAGTPFVVKANQNEVTFETLRLLYKSNKEIFDAESRRFKSSNGEISSPNELFTTAKLMSSTTHISWRMNKMPTARVIRSVFPKPFFLPDRSGQSVERFVFIDGVKAEPYLLPNTECSYVFIVQGTGERTIVLKPAKECVQKCRTVSVVMKKNHILWYNWWYWRPLSLPTKNSSEISITYINSYC